MSLQLRSKPTSGSSAVSRDHWQEEGTESSGFPLRSGARNWNLGECDVKIADDSPKMAQDSKIGRFTLPHSAGFISTSKSNSQPFSPAFRPLYKSSYFFLGPKKRSKTFFA